MLHNIQKEKIKLAKRNIDCTDVDEKLQIALIKVNQANYKKEVDSLNSKKNKEGKSAAVFHLKERILRSKKVSMESVVLVDPRTGFVADTPVSLDYCTRLLTDSSPREGFEGAYMRSE